MRIKGLSRALVSRCPEAEGNLRLVKFMFPSRGESRQKAAGYSEKEKDRARKKQRERERESARDKVRRGRWTRNS